MKESKLRWKSCRVDVMRLPEPAACEIAVEEFECILGRLVLSPQ
jgi:hypothetical protein